MVHAWAMLAIYKSFFVLYKCVLCVCAKVWFFVIYGCLLIGTCAVIWMLLQKNIRKYWLGFLQKNVKYVHNFCDVTVNKLTIESILLCGKNWWVARAVLGMWVNGVVYNALSWHLSGSEQHLYTKSCNSLGYLLLFVVRPCALRCCRALTGPCRASHNQLF